MKYMTFNSSCSYAGVANMLELEGVEAGDRQIALDMGLPYLFSFQDGAYCSGPMLQTAEWFNLYLRPRGFCMTETELFREDVPGFLEGIPYAMLGILKPSGGKHAVVYTGKKGDRWNFINCRPPEFTVMSPGKHPAGGPQSGCIVNLTGCSINNWRQESSEPGTISLSREELLQRLDSTVTAARLQKASPAEVDLRPYFRNSAIVLQQLKRDITAFSCREQTPRDLRAARESLFRAILLDGITMLELIGETQLLKRLKAIQKDFLDALRENQPLVLADRISVNDLGEAIDAYVALISQKAV